MLSFGYIVRTKCPVLMPIQNTATADVFHNLYVPAWLQHQAATVLNSTVAMLMVEYGGRANLSGILKVQLYEMERLTVPNPVGVVAAPTDALMASDHPLVTRDQRTESGFRLTLTDTRRKIDEPVFAYLGLTRDEQDAVYNETYDAIVKRQIAEANVA